MKKIYTLKRTLKNSGEQLFSGIFYINKEQAERIAKLIRNENDGEKVDIIECDLYDEE